MKRGPFSGTPELWCAIALEAMYRAKRGQEGHPFSRGEGGPRLRRDFLTVYCSNFILDRYAVLRGFWKWPAARGTNDGNSNSEES